MIKVENTKITIPESIKIKRNLDGTYNLYALIRSQYAQGDKKVESLVGLKSKGLIFNKDLEFCIELSSSCNSVSNGYGAKLYTWMDERQILYNMKFSKSTDVLLDFEVLNEGDGIMNYNVFEGLENYSIQINVAGFTREELSVVVENEIIRVRTMPSHNTFPADKDCLIKNFERTKSECEIYLPNMAEPIEAELKDGILYLNIPKFSKGVKIAIK